MNKTSGQRITFELTSTSSGGKNQTGSKFDPNQGLDTILRGGCHAANDVLNDGVAEKRLIWDDKGSGGGPPDDRQRRQQDQVQTV